MACPAAHPLAGRAHVKWEELGEYDYITLAQE
ncbi:hypothetical protein ACTMU2_14790 [Cupriavidus basilensis]